MKESGGNFQIEQSYESRMEEPLALSEVQQAIFLEKNIPLAHAATMIASPDGTYQGPLAQALVECSMFASLKSPSVMNMLVEHGRKTFQEQNPEKSHLAQHGQAIALSDGKKVSFSFNTMTGIHEDKVENSAEATITKHSTQAVVIERVTEAAKPLVEKIVHQTANDQTGSNEHAAAVGSYMNTDEHSTNGPDVITDGIKIIDSVLAPVKISTDILNIAVLQSTERAEAILQPTSEVIPEISTGGNNTQIASTETGEASLDTEGEAIIPGLSLEYTAQHHIVQSDGDEVFIQAVKVAPHDYVTPVYSEDLTQMHVSVKKDETFLQFSDNSECNEFTEDQPNVLVEELQEDIRDVWRAALAVPMVTVSESMSGEQKHSVALSSEYLTAHVLSSEPAGVNEDGQPISMSELIVAQVREQIIALPENESTETGLVLIEDVQQLTGDINYSVHVLTNEIEQVFAEGDIPEELQFMFEDDQPVSVQTVLEQFAIIDLETLPESVVAVYYELLQKIVELQKVTEKFTYIFDISYDVQTHQLIVEPKNTDPMREKLAKNVSLGDYALKGVKDLQDYLGYVVLRSRVPSI